MISRFSAIFCHCVLITLPLLTRAATLEIHEGDHICLIGNTLAERMQFEGHNHWETLLHQRFPKHHLVVRNLAWPADEVVLRPRAEGFGTPDDQLTFCKADVVIAFFGFNESFAGEAGLEKFKNDLEEWIQHTKAQSYNGQSAPRIALVSPIAAESSPAFRSRDHSGTPQGDATSGFHRLDSGMSSYVDALNARIELYTKAMKEVAEKNGVVFANVFIEGPFRLPGQLEELPRTFNGVHLNIEGDKWLGHELLVKLFGIVPESLPQTREERDRELFKDAGFELLRGEIEAKSKLWYHRYRIIDS